MRGPSGPRFHCEVSAGSGYARRRVRSCHRARGRGRCLRRCASRCGRSRARGPGRRDRRSGRDRCRGRARRDRRTDPQDSSRRATCQLATWWCQTAKPATARPRFGQAAGEAAVGVQDARPGRGRSPRRRDRSGSRRDSAAQSSRQRASSAGAASRIVRRSLQAVQNARPDRMPLWKHSTSYFSLGEWIWSSSLPKPISMASMPSTVLK